MKIKEDVPNAPVFLGERVIDDRFARFGKRIVERDFKMPDGRVLPILCVSNSGMNPSIIFALTARETIFLVKQFRFGTNDWVLELPGGCQASGGGWEEVAKAELLSEVGVEAESMKVIGEPMPVDPALGNAGITAVLATGCRVVRPQELDGAETMSVTEVTVKRFREMLKKGEITDTKTVAVGYLAMDHLGLLG
ncbi:MAG: NUDIX hydrolase [Parcubacteria group bacterium Gr01-1014_91]|nr:MAG: NUDIX hydrolase [Parcubacteria group bacterium Gr01-1014_91]